MKTVHAVKSKTMAKLTNLLTFAIIISQNIKSTLNSNSHDTTRLLFVCFLFKLKMILCSFHLFLLHLYSAWKSLSCFRLNLIFNYCDYFWRCLIFLIVAFVNALKKWTNESDDCCATSLAIFMHNHQCLVPLCITNSMRINLKIKRNNNNR